MIFNAPDCVTQNFSKKIAVLMSFELLIKAFTVFFLFALIPSISIAKNDIVNILVLQSYHISLPWSVEFQEGLDEVSSEYKSEIRYFVENLNLPHARRSLSVGEWKNYLSAKYQGIQFDGVIADSAPASSLLEEISPIFLNKLPQAFYTVKPIKEASYRLSLLSQEETAIRETAKLAMKQNPSVRNIVVILGPDTEDQYVKQILLPMLKELGVNLQVIEDFSLTELVQKISQIPKKSIVFYDLVFNDSTGKHYIPKQVLQQVATVSPAPVYSFWSSLIGSGVIGGHMVDGKRTAKQLVTAIMDYKQTGRFKSEYDMLQKIFDWKALESHNIDPKTISSDAIVINKMPNIFKAYRVEMGFIVFVLGLVFVISTLWLIKLRRVNKKLHYEKQRAEHLARKDQLTGLYNRRAFFEFAEQILREAARNKKPVSVFILDIDHFKSVNDNFGHPTGDEVLKATAKMIQETKREIDICARFGGEEFIVLLPFTDLEGASQLADRIRMACAAHKVEYDGQSLSITISVGVAYMSTINGADEIHVLIKKADDALYKAKNQGRNRVVLHSNNNYLLLSEGL